MNADWRLKEREVTRQIRDYLEWQGWRGLRNQVSAAQNMAGGWFRSGEKGMPDYLFLYYFRQQMPGVCLQLWIEIKREGEDLRPEQIAWHLAETARGGLVWTVDKFESFQIRYQTVFGWLSKHKEGQLVLGE